MTKIAKTLLSLTLGLALFGTSAQAKQTLRWSEPSEIQTLDPALSVDTTSSEMMRNSYEGLYRFENNGQVKKALVKKETRSADGLTYTFTLQKNAKWSNGDRVTAKDFVYSWQRAVDPNTKASNAQLFDGIKNAAAWKRIATPVPMQSADSSFFRNSARLSLRLHRFIIFINMF